MEKLTNETWLTEVQRNHFVEMDKRKQHIDDIKEGIKLAIELNSHNSALFLCNTWKLCIDYYDQYDYKDDVIKRIESLKSQIVDTK